MLYLIIAIIVVVILYLLYYYKNSESFLNEIKKVKQGPQLLDDKVFADVVTYDNVYDAKGNARLGLDACLEACSGVCVEYGITGVAHCFPKTKALGRNYYTAVKDYEHEWDEIDRSGEKLVYPSMR